MINTLISSSVPIKPRVPPPLQTPTLSRCGYLIYDLLANVANLMHKLAWSNIDNNIQLAGCLVLQSSIIAFNICINISNCSFYNISPMLLSILINFIIWDFIRLSSWTEWYKRENIIYSFFHSINLNYFNFSVSRVQSRNSNIMFRTIYIFYPTHTHTPITRFISDNMRHHICSESRALSG